MGFFFFFYCLLFLSTCPNPVKNTRPSPHTLPRYAHLGGRDTDLTTLRGACELWCKRCVACVCVSMTHRAAAAVQLRSSEVKNSAIGLTTANSFHCCAHHRRPLPLQLRAHCGVLQTRRVVQQQQCVIAAHDIKRHGQSRACCCARSTTRFRSQTHFPPIHAPT